MSQGAAAEIRSTGDDKVDSLLRESRAWLAERGEIVVGSGSFRSGRLSGSIHSDFGPVNQDKPTNQDYVLAWYPKETASGAAVSGQNESKARAEKRITVPPAVSLPRFAMALGDGLTTSFRSECASALACWIALRALVEFAGPADPRDRARLAFNEAGLTIGLLTDALARDPEASCPEGQFLSTWKYILNKGGLLQTTLTLAWLDWNRFYLAMIGDAGALWRCFHTLSDGGRPTDRILAACDLASQEVRALGPTDRCIQDFDCWQTEQITGPFLCAVSTDGIGRGLGASPLALLEELERLHAAGEENPARRFIEHAIQTRPKDFEDNLTLAVIRME